MEDISRLIGLLLDHDNKAACGAAQELCRLSAASDQVYPYFDRFVTMLESRNSLVRNRGIMLIAANARWDQAGRLAEVLDQYLAHVEDEKPITARQCIQALPQIAAARPELAGRIQAALEAADASRYADSMRPLVQKDLLAAIARIDP